MRPGFPMPVLALHGEQGSGKSFLASLVKTILDPTAPQSRGLPRETRDPYVAARNGWIPSFDNVSGVADWMGDNLSSLSTGGGFGTRELHSDHEKALFEGYRPAILNGIPEALGRSDLRSRMITLHLPGFSEDDRKSEVVLRDLFREKHPAILWALCVAASAALRNIDKTRLPTGTRMRDFAIWVTAAEGGLGWEPGAFLRDYESNRARMVALEIDGDPVAAATLDLVPSCGDWTGTASELLARLGEKVTEGVRNSRPWPRTPQHLTGHLRRLSPSLRQVGITVRRERTSEKNPRRMVHSERAVDREAPAGMLHAARTVSRGWPRWRRSAIRPRTDTVPQTRPGGARQELGTPPTAAS